MKYYIFIVGCAMNYSDSERIAAVFDSFGFTRSKSEEDANILIAVSCSVRQTAVDRIYGKSGDWKKRKKKDPGFLTILSGCVLPEDKKKLKESFDLIFEINNIEELKKFLVSSVKKINSKNKNNLIKNESDYSKILNCDKDYLSIIPSYESSFRAYVPIMTGCNNFCSYCAVPYVRGREKSRPSAEIIKEIKNLVKRGFKEIILLGQNVNSYQVASNEKFLKVGGHRNRESFLKLIKKIDQIGGDYRVYFYSNHPKDMSLDLISAMSNLKHFPPYIHLPLQSGSDRILKSMNRHYTQKEYLGLVSRIKKDIPNVGITTDVIVGYPGETVEDFNQTKKVFERVGFEMAFISTYSPRPMTASSKIKDDIPLEEKRRREKILTEILRKNLILKNKKMIGKKVRVLIDGKKGEIFYGRDDLYKVVEIETDKPIVLGQFVKVKIIKTDTWKIKGRVISH